jgi:hypothetical protein
VYLIAALIAVTPLIRSEWDISNVLREAIYTLPSGREKDRLTQSHLPREWRTIVATSSNVPFADILTQGHVPFDASMGVRYIDDHYSLSFEMTSPNNSQDSPLKRVSRRD